MKVSRSLRNKIREYIQIRETILQLNKRLDQLRREISSQIPEDSEISFKDFIAKISYIESEREQFSKEQFIQEHPELQDIINKYVKRIKVQSVRIFKTEKGGKD